MHLEVAGAAAKTVTIKGGLEIEIQVVVRDTTGAADLVVSDIMQFIDSIVAEENMQDAIAEVTLGIDTSQVDFAEMRAQGVI